MQNIYSGVKEPTNETVVHDIEISDKVIRLIVPSCVEKSR